MFRSALATALACVIATPVVAQTTHVSETGSHASQRVELRVVLRATGEQRRHAATADPVDFDVASDSGTAAKTLLLRDERAPHVFDYEVAESCGVSAPALYGGAIRFVPADANPHVAFAAGHFVESSRALELQRPVVTDANGLRSETAAAWAIAGRPGETTRIRLRIDPAGLEYPLTVSLSFGPTATMGAQRTNHIAALLPNGKVLIAGGYNGSSVLDTADIYDPATGTFTAAGPMEVARQNAAAVVLLNGKVLIAGGNDGSGPLDSAELYDPGWNSFDEIAATMTTTRNGPSATLLENGKVLITGGVHPETLDSAEEYDPVTQTFSTTAGSMHSPRVLHTATRLADGDVLIAGGFSGVVPLGSGELYDPTTRTFTSLSYSMFGARDLHTATLLPNGKVLITGGLSTSGALHAAELYDPATRGFQVTSETMAVARYFHVATLLPDGDVLITGGHLSGELYDADTDTFTTVANAPSAVRFNATATVLPTGNVLIAGGTTGTTPLNTAEIFTPYGPGTMASCGEAMDVGRFRSTATVLEDGRVLIAGGEGLLFNSSADLYDPATDTFTPVAGAMTSARMRHTATLLGDGTVLLTGGTANGVDSLSSAETFDPDTMSFTATLGPMHAARQHHSATLLADGTVLIAGGAPANGSAPSNTAEIYDPSTRSFVSVGMMAAARSFAPAVLLPSGKVLIAGGQDSSGALWTAELFDPRTRQFTFTGSMTWARDVPTATLLPDGNVLVAGGGTNENAALDNAEIYSSWVGTFSLAPDTMTAARGRHRAALLPDGRVLLTGGFAGTYLDSADLYDPIAGTFAAAPAMSVARSSPTLAMLPTGKLFIAGGSASGTAGTGYHATAELYDPGLSSPARRPAISSITNPLCQLAHLSLAGSLFTGDSEGTGGRANSAAANAPLVRLRRLDSEFRCFANAQSASASSVYSINVWDLASGRYGASVVSNGISSIEEIIDVETNPELATYAAASVTSASSTTISAASYPLGFNGLNYAQRVSASAGFTGTFAIDGATGAISVADANPIGNYTVTVNASNACGSASSSFALKVLGPPASMTASGGTPQSTAISTAFALPLSVTVRDSASHPLENVAVVFSAPIAGARATLSGGGMALTNAFGVASVTATANTVMGAYTVTAVVGALTATFSLTNIPATPASVVATAATATSVVITWTGTPSATYEVQRVGAAGATTIVGSSAAGTFTDNTAAANTTYLYKVRAIAPFASPFGTGNLATTVIFTDPSIVSTKIKAVHITQLRTAVNAARAIASLPAATYTDPALVAGTTSVKAAHVTELRSALGAARAALALPALTYARPSLAHLAVETDEIMELRNGVK